MGIDLTPKPVQLDMDDTMGDENLHQVALNEEFSISRQSVINKNYCISDGSCNGAFDKIIGQDTFDDVETVLKNDYMHTASPKELDEIENLYNKPTVQNMEGHRSMLKRCLTREMLDRLKHKKTNLGGGLADCIRSGCEHPDSLVGLYATDVDAYETFGELFDACTRGFHEIPMDKDITHPEMYFGDISGFEPLDSSGDYIISTRVRVGRTLDGYPFPPLLSSKTRKVIETNIVNALNSLDGELKGAYLPISSMDQVTQEQLVQQHYLFRPDSRFRRCVGGYTDWPDGRGIFFNEDKTFLAWVNEGDHLRIISMEQGGDLYAVYNRLVKGVLSLGQKLKFARNKKLGYLAFCPTNVGTSLRASVLIRIPHVAESEGTLDDICERFHLQARGVHGEHTKSEGGVYDISNVRRLGLTELQAVTDMYQGVKELIKVEKQLCS